MAPLNVVSPFLVDVSFPFAKCMERCPDGVRILSTGTFLLRVYALVFEEACVAEAFLMEMPPPKR